MKHFCVANHVAKKKKYYSGNDVIERTPADLMTVKVNKSLKI